MQQGQERGALKVGLIGLGAMGRGMATSLRRAGFAPNVYDLRREAAEEFAREGGTACATLAELGAASDVVISVVVNAAQTEEVLFGPSRSADGTTNLIGALRRAMATTGYTELKEFQRVELVVSPYKDR